MNIYYSKENAMYWLEIDKGNIRIPFNEVSDKATDYNVVLFNSE